MLLFTGPIVLKGKISNPRYTHFLLLRVGIFILVNSCLQPIYCDFAEGILTNVVTHFGQLYGNDMLIYNILGLVRLADETQRFGSLDNISSFPYENILQVVEEIDPEVHLPSETSDKEIV